MTRFIAFVLRHRWATLVLVLAATAALLSEAGKLSIVIDPDETLPQDHPYLVATNLAEALFGNKYTVVIGLTPAAGDALQPEVLDAVGRITGKLAADPGVVKANLVSLAAPLVKDIAGSADGLSVKPIMSAVPRTAAEFDELRKALQRNPVYRGLLVSRDGRSAAIIAEFKRDAGGYKAIAARVEAIVAPSRSPALQIDVAGQPILLGLLESFSNRVLFLFPVALLVIGLIHFDAFRSWQGLVLPLATGLLAVAWALGFMGLAGKSLDAFNAATPILVLTVAAGHAVQILKRYYEEYRHAAARSVDPRAANEDAIIRSLTATGPVMIAAGVTAVASFSSLMVFDITTIRTFGLFTALGILCALVIELTFIPALRAILPPPTVRHVQREERRGFWDRITAVLTAQSVHRPWATLAASAVLLAVAGIGASRVVTDNSLRSYFLPSLEARRADAALNAHLAGNNVLNIVVRGREDDAIKSPAVLRAMDATQRFLEREPAVGRTVSIVDFVRQIDRAMNEDSGAAGNRPLPDNRETIAQYLLLYSMSGEPGDFDSYVDYAYKDAIITAYLREEGSRYLTGLDRRLEDFMRGVFPPTVEVSVGGRVMSPVAQNEVLVGSKLRNIGQIALAVFVVSSLLFRSMVGGLLVLVPLCFAVAVNFGVMGWTGIPLQVATATVSAMAVGIGADYAIYLLYRLREEARRTGGDPADAVRRTFDSAGKAILFVASAVSGGYSVLMLSYGFLVHFWLGFLTSVAMLASAGAALTTLMSLVMILRPRFIFDRAVEVEMRPITKVTAALVLFAVFAPGYALAAGELSADDVMRRNFVASRVGDSASGATFTLANRDGQQRVRNTVSRTKLEEDGIRNMRLIRFQSPQDVRGTATLTIENADRDDDVWIYLPALKKTRRLLASNHKDSFVGTDFSYGDIIGLKVEDWRHTLVREEAVDGSRCYVVESVPATPAAQENSGYSKRVQWIRADNFVTVRGEYYDKAGQLLKTLLTEDIRQVDAANDRWQPMRLTMRNVQTGHSTVVQLSDFKANQGLSAREFTARELDREQ